MSKPHPEPRHGGRLTDRDKEAVAKAFGFWTWENLEQVLKRQPRSRRRVDSSEAA